MRKHINVALVAFSVSLIASGCTPSIGAAKTGVIEGRVMKGPVNGGAVTAYRVNSDGRRDGKIGTAVTDENGAFAVSIGDHGGPTLVCAKDGTYTEEATGGLVQLGGGELCALVDGHVPGSTRKGVVLSPFTSFHAVLTSCMSELGRENSLAKAASRAALRINDFAAAGVDGFDFRSTMPFEVTRAVAPSLTAEVWHGILLAGLSESARQISLESDLDPGVRVTAMTLTTELLRDLDDGECRFDGQGPSGQLSQGVVALSANSLRGAPNGMAQSIHLFLDGDHNLSGVHSEAVLDLTHHLSSHTSEIFGGTADGDLTPPEVTILEPVAGFISGVPTIRVSAIDANSIDTIVITAPEELAGSGTFACTEPTSCELVSTFNTSLFEPGDVTLTVVATDAAGNTGTDAVTVTINNSTPQIQVQSPSPNQVLAGVVPLQATVTDEDGVASFAVAVPGVVIAPNCVNGAANNCDRAPDPNIIDVLLDTAVAPEGPLEIRFDAVDTAGVPAFEVVPVVVDNLGVGTFAGRAEFGASLKNAAITAYAYDNGARGAVIGTATTTAEGLYQIQNPSHAGAVELVVTGGNFIDPSTGQDMSLRAGQSLRALVAQATLGQAVQVNVNAWTTLVAKRTDATLNESPSFASALTFNTNLFASHMLRPGTLSLTASSSADLLTQNPAPSDAAALLALTHAGLSRLAAQTSFDIGGDAGQITPIDLLDVLLDDISDGVFDGTDNGTGLFLDAESVEATSYVIRTDLAVAINNFVRNAPFRRNGAVMLEADRNHSTITSAALAAPDLLFDDLSTNRSVLFPANVVVIPFDQTGPTVELSFGVPNSNAVMGDTLSGVVAVIGVASDTSGLSSFDVLTPEVDDLFSPVADLRVELDGAIAPNQAEVLAQCGIVLGDPPYDLTDPERQVCVCAEARDALENIGRELLCFTRERPSVQVTPDAFIGPAVTAVTVVAHGQFHLATCNGQLHQGSTSLGTASSTATDFDCTVAIPVTGMLSTAPVELTAEIVEAGGARTAVTRTFTVDVTSPQLAITTPTPGASMQSSPTLAVTASDTNLESVIATVTTPGVPLAIDLVGVATAGTTTYTFPTFEDAQPDGIRTIIVTARDRAGNTTTVQQSYSKDTTPPVITPGTAADGAPLKYMKLKETTAFSPSAECSCVNGKNADGGECPSGQPFAGCIFNVTNASLRDVVRQSAADAAMLEPYERWAFLITSRTNPTTLASPPTDGRAPTLRMHTEPNLVVKARVDATCATPENFAVGSLASFTADIAGIVDVPITFASLVSQTGEQTLCMTMATTDRAGNVSPIVQHFFRYRSTAPPVHVLWNHPAYNAAANQNDVASLDAGDDDDVYSGSGQGAGRVLAHAYLVTPSTSFLSNYTMEMAGVAMPTIKVLNRHTAHISKVRARDWCFLNGGEDDLVNPDAIVPDEVNSPENLPAWSGSSLDRGSAQSSWALWIPMGGALSGANVQLEHAQSYAGESDTTVFDPEATYPTNADTVLTEQIDNSLDIPTSSMSFEAWSITSTGAPNALEDDDTNKLLFTLGGSNAAGRHRILFVRAVVPNNAVTLKKVQAINNAVATQGFNDPCPVSLPAGLTNQREPMPSGKFVIVDEALPVSPAREVVTPKSLLWVRSGGFTECNGTESRDCRYGRYFVDYRGGKVEWPSGRSLRMTGKISTAPSTSFASLSDRSLPSGTVRTLNQEN